MSDTYSEGTISIATGSHSVVGTGTYFKSIGLVKAGSMLTLDGNKYYLITDVVDDRHLTIEHTIDGTPFAEAGVGGASYTVVKNFARQTNTGLASDFIAFQNELLQNKFEFFNWLNATTDRHVVRDTQGGSKNILTPKGFDSLIADLADGNIEIGDLSATWDNIIDKPVTATRWPTFDEVTSKPDTYPPTFHNHEWGEVTSKPETAVRWPTFSEVTGKPATYPPTTHFHEWDDIADKPSEYPPSTHGHDWSDITGRPSTYPSDNHQHGWDEVNQKPDTATRWPTFDEVTGKPSSYTPEEHVHNWSEINGKPDTATQWPNFTQVTGTLGESQLPEVAVTADQLSQSESEIENAISEVVTKEGNRGLRQSPANFNHDHNAYNHIHHDLLPKSLSELPPEYPPIKAPVLHFDSAQKKVHALFSSNDVTDSLEINGYKARRHFYVIDQPTYIQFNSLYTGKLSYRVFRWSTDTNAIPGLADATLNQWSTVTVDVTDLDNFGTDGTGNYFYGIVDWICLEDKGVFVKLDKSFYVKDHTAGTYNAYIPALGTIQKNSGPLDDPFVECFLRVDGRWESKDITPEVPFDIEPEWTQQSERVYTCSNVEEPDDAVEFFPTYKTDYKTMTWAVVIRSLAGALTTAISNQGPHQSSDVGTHIYEGTGERICLKRAYAVLTTKVQVLFIKQLITDPDTYGN